MYIYSFIPPILVGEPNGGSFYGYKPYAEALFDPHQFSQSGSVSRPNDMGYAQAWISDCVHSGGYCLVVGKLGSVSNPPPQVLPPAQPPVSVSEPAVVFLLATGLLIATFLGRKAAYGK